VIVFNPQLKSRDALGVLRPIPVRQARVSFFNSMMESAIPLEISENTELVDSIRSASSFFFALCLASTTLSGTSNCRPSALIVAQSCGFCRKRASLLFFALATRCRVMRQALNPLVAKVLKCLHYPLDVILLCVRWYSAYPLSLRNLEEMMAERGISVDHSTVHRSAIKLLPVMEKMFRRSKRKVGKSWRMDEAYIKVKGEWKYLYLAVDKAGDTVDLLLRAHRDKVAACRFFEQAIEQNGAPEKVTIDKSGSNARLSKPLTRDEGSGSSCAGSST